MSENSLLETIDATCVRLNLSRSTVYELLRDRQIEAVKIGRARRVVIASSHAYVERLRAITNEQSESSERAAS